MVLLVINDSLHIQMKLNIEMFNEYTYAINSIYSVFIITHLMEGRITNKLKHWEILSKLEQLCFGLEGYKIKYNCYDHLSCLTEHNI